MLWPSVWESVVSKDSRLQTQSRWIDYTDHNDSDYFNIIDGGDADYVKGLQTVSRHKVLALQVATGLFRLREREEGQNQIRWWTEKCKNIHTKKREDGQDQDSIEITSSFASVNIIIKLSTQEVGVRYNYDDPNSNGVDYEKDVERKGWWWLRQWCQYLQPTKQAYGMQSSNYNNQNYIIINNYNNYTIMKSILTGHQPSKHMVCRAPGQFVYPSSHPPYFLRNWKIYPTSKYHPHQHHHQNVFFGIEKYISSF